MRSINWQIITIFGQAELCEQGAGESRTYCSSGEREFRHWNCRENLKWEGFVYIGGEREREKEITCKVRKGKRVCVLCLCGYLDTRHNLLRFRLHFLQNRFVVPPYRRRMNVSFIDSTRLHSTLTSQVMEFLCYHSYPRAPLLFFNALTG